MPTAQSANTITIASRINTVIIKALLVHAILASGVMIGLQSQHTQGASPMNDKKRRHRLTWRGGLIGTLLPMALATSADRKSVVDGTSASVRVDHGGRRIIK